MLLEMPRHAWTSTPRPTSDLVRMVPSRLHGFAVHWPGTSTAHAPLDETGVARWLEAERHDHVAGRGWTDIAYATGFDLAGRVWDLRGLPWQVAANGSSDLNRTWSAVTLILGAHDTPSPAMIAAVQTWRAIRFLPAYPRATRVVGHRDVHPTACPGPAAYRLVRAGTFTRTPGVLPTPSPQEIAMQQLFTLAATDAADRFSAVFDPARGWVAQPLRGPAGAFLDDLGKAGVPVLTAPLAGIHAQCTMLPVPTPPKTGKAAAAKTTT